MFNVNSAVGTYLDNYHLTEMLTSNVSNFLFLAEKDSVPKHVFLVKIRRDLELHTQEQQEAFLQRANTLKAFHHPYMLPLLNIGIDQSIPYIVTAYEKHGSLYDRLQKQAECMLPVDEIHMLLARVGVALYAAHQAEIIHGNLKTQNIIFNQQYEAMLADFSLFPSSPPNSTTTKHIAIVTPGYNVSELHKNTENPSKESDLYALGLIAYELFTGQRAFTMPSKSNSQKIYKVRSLIPPRQLNPHLDSSVEQALLKALAKDATQRYSDIPTFLAALGISSHLAKHPISIKHATDTSVLSPPPSNEVAAQYATMEIRQPKLLQIKQKTSVGAHLEPISLPKTKEVVHARTVSTRHKNFILFSTILLLILLLSGVVYSIHTIIDSIHATISQSQLRHAAELSGPPTSTVLAVNSVQAHQNHIIAVSSTSTPQATATATTKPSQGVVTTQPMPTIPSPKPACSIAYKKTSDSQGRFVATIVITNTGTTTINGWALIWTYANGQSLYSVWGSSYQQNGAQVILQNLSWDKVIQPGQGVNNIGISGTYPHGINSNPTSFTLNGMQCG